MFTSRIIVVFFIAFSGFALFPSCSEEIKKKLLPSFPVNIPAIILTVPPIAFVSDKEIPVGALRTRINLDSIIMSKTGGAFGASAVTSISVKKITVRMLNANAANNLSNFASVRMTIYANNSAASADIADITFPPAYTDSLTIVNTNNVEISSFLKGAELGYNLFWTNRRITTKYLKLMVSLTLNVQ